MSAKGWFLIDVAFCALNAVMFALYDKWWSLAAAVICGLCAVYMAAEAAS